MTKSRFKLMMTTMMAALVLAIPGSALAEEKLKAHLSQATWCGETLLPAGEYTIRTIEMSSDQPVLSVSNEEGLHILVPAMRMKQISRPDRTELVIRRDSDAARLSVVRFGGSDYSYELFPLGPRDQR